MSRYATGPRCARPRPRRSQGRTALMASISAITSASVKRRMKSPAAVGTRDHLRAQGLHVGHVAAQTVEVPVPLPPAEDVAGDTQDVIRLAVREMALDEIEPMFDLVHHPETVDELADHSGPIEADRADPVPDLKMDPARPEERPLLTPSPWGSSLERLHLLPSTRIFFGFSRVRLVSPERPLG